MTVCTNQHRTNFLRNTDGTTPVYQYDHAGNIVANADRNIASIQYDHRNLAQLIVTDDGVHRYLYNAEGLRTGKLYKPHSSGSWTVNTRYVRGAYGELLAQYNDDQLQYWNLLAASGEVIGRMDENDETRYYYLKDHLGSVRVTIDDDGDIVGYDDYFPFGMQMSGRSNNAGHTDDDMKFTGHFLETEGGLGIYHAGARLYDPEVPRFYGVDAVRGGFPDWSPYTYALNNPLIYVDPDGRISTHTDSTGVVIEVYDDGDHGVYVHYDASTKEEIDNKREKTGTTSGGGEKIGETEFIDEFSPGNLLNLNYGTIDEWVAIQQYKYVISQADMNPVLVALLSEPGGPLDIKTRLPGDPTRGYQYDGYWMTSQSAGNRLAGKNAALLNMPWSLTIGAAGALHVGSNRSIGSIQYWGETKYAGRQIRSGYLSIPR